MHFGGNSSSWCCFLVKGLSFFLHGTLFYCLKILKTWLMTSPGVNEPRKQSRNGNVFYELAPEVTPQYFHHILHMTQINFDTMSEGLYRLWIPESEANWVHIGGRWPHCHTLHMKSFLTIPPHSCVLFLPSWVPLDSHYSLFHSLVYRSLSLSLILHSLNLRARLYLVLNSTSRTAWLKFVN